MRKCVENGIKKCVECRLVNKKRGKGEEVLNPVPKNDQLINIDASLKLQSRHFEGTRGKWENLQPRMENARQYQKGEFVAIVRTQFGKKLKIRPNYFEPCQVTKVKLRDRYDVAKIGDHEGPNVTSPSADQMKPWTKH
ncbi:uncharacterized protein TNCV_3991401 [Trichonephila clavipes]|uniref:Uncharacterized protein n=1 Tax=Trichonephila clavipes TaxID=2585209 RepID=A0A8X6T633_TRICX|nr:uncharacterized protein TNCV_3991401 [Trichonephila clavipes]